MARATVLGSAPERRGDTAARRPYHAKRMQCGRGDYRASVSTSSADVANVSTLAKRAINWRQVVRDSPVLNAAKAFAICFPLERVARRQPPAPSLFTRAPLSI